jgi:hypothetical protein
VAASALLLWLLDDLRRGALMLALAGLALGVMIRVVAATPLRMALAAAALFVIVGVAVSHPRTQGRVIDAVESAARVHAGHVFTVGHAYKLLDEGFYKIPAAPAAWPLELSGAQAARFVVRSVVAFVTIPWPWQMRSAGELAYLPDQLIWYLMIIGLPAGVVAGWKRDPWTVSILVGLAVPLAAAVALTNGNVGTLLRLRGLVTPYLLWIGALGLLAMVNAGIGATAPTTRIGFRRLEGHV